MRAGRRLVEDFLLPALDDQRYGDLLKWEDKEKLHFSIRWSHKNAAKWSLNDTKVFQDWDRMKGHFRPEIKGYYMQAKQRFRAALYKLNTVKKLKSEDKHVKKYQLVEKYQVLGSRRKRQDESMMEFNAVIKKEPADESQTCIPTAVICWNDGHTDRSQDQVYPWTPTYFIQNVPESSTPNYPIPNSHNSGRKMDNGCSSSPPLQENHVTFVQEQQHLNHFVKTEPETSRTSSPVQEQRFVKVEPETSETSNSDSASLPDGPCRSIPGCTHESRLVCSRNFFAQLNLVQRGTVGTSKPTESDFVPNKKLCAFSCEPTVLKPPSESSHETPLSFDVVAKFENLATEPSESPFSEGGEDKPTSSVPNTVGHLSTIENREPNEIPDPAAESAVCGPKFKVKPELLQRKDFPDVFRKASGSPHVPIPPLPGYSKSSVMPRRTEGQHNAFVIRDQLVSQKTKPGTSNSSKMVWQRVDSIPCTDGPLNLSTKPGSCYKSEVPVFTDR